LQHCHVLQVLGQLHPATARIEPDEDGLLPEWIIYHELVATARTFLRYVRLFSTACDTILQLPASAFACLPCTFCNRFSPEYGC
jgi:hypothetical protein